MGAKIVLILGTCVIIGLVLQMKNSKQDTDKVGSTTLNADNSSKYNVFTEKQAVKNSGTSLASNGKTINSDDINNCAEQCSLEDDCGGFNYINNQCTFITGTILYPVTIVSSGVDVTAYAKIY